GADHEGQPDKDKRNAYAERGEGDADPEFGKQRTDPAVLRIERGERDPRDRGWQGEGEIDHGIDNLAPGKAVADQNPGDNQPEYGIDQRRDEGNPEADPEGRDHPRVEDRADKLRPGHLRREEDHGGKRDQHDQPHVKEREAKRHPEPRDDAVLPESDRPVTHAQSRSLRGLVDFIEDAAVPEE